MDRVGQVATITSLFQIEALSSPVRTRILRYAGDPITVAELAERLGVPTTRLYYHVNLLVEAGMLAQVDERRSGARIEKVYRRTAEQFQLGAELAEVAGEQRKAAEAATTVLFDPARAEVEDFLERTLGHDREPAHLGRTIVRLTPEAAERVAERLDGLVSEIRDLDVGEDDEQGRTYSMTAAFIPVDPWAETS